MKTKHKILIYLGPFSCQAEKWEILGGAKQHYSPVDLVRRPQMRKRAIILFYIWYVLFQV